MEAVELLIFLAKLGWLAGHSILSDDKSMYHSQHTKQRTVG